VDANVPADLWTNHHRIHQYMGGHNEVYAGVTINIDQDYFDVSIWPSGTSRQRLSPSGSVTRDPICGSGASTPSSCRPAPASRDPLPGR
jgi:hypothetical protein